MLCIFNSHISKGDQGYRTCNPTMWFFEILHHYGSNFLGNLHRYGYVIRF